MPSVLTGHHPALDHRTTADFKLALGVSALKEVKRALGCSKSSHGPQGVSLEIAAMLR